MRTAPVAVLTAALALAACRSPFQEADEGGPPEDPQKVGVGVHGWPLYERAPGSRGVRTDVLWPVASVRTSPDGDLRRADLLVPIVLWQEDGTRSRFGVRPFFDVETDSDPGAEVEDVDLLFPLVKWRSAPGEGRFEVRPVWFRRWKADESDLTLLLPFYGSSWKPDESFEFVWPLWGEHRKEEERTDWWASGLVIREEDPSQSLTSTKLLLGAFESAAWDDGERLRAFPLWWSEGDESGDREEWHALWPGLVGTDRRGDDRTSWAVPFWYSHRTAKSSTDVVAPFWYSHEDEDRSTRVVFPFYGRQTEPDFERTFWGGSLFIDTTTKDGGSVDVVWPLFHAGTDAEGWDARVFPVLWLDRNGDEGHTHLWPLFGSSWDGGRTEASVAWPFFTVESGADGWEANLPAPLVSIDRKGKRHETAVFPLLHHEEDVEKGSYEGDVLLLLSNWEGDGEGASDFRILWRLVQATDTGDREVVAVNPLFRRETNARGDLHWSALFGLVARTREEEDVRWRLLWFLTF
jgi:hypothetical protein